MSRFVRASQLRNLVVQEYPLAEDRFTELGGGGGGDVQSGGNLIAASASFVAFAHSSAGNSAVAAVRVDKPGKQAKLAAQSCQTGGIYDVEFCPSQPDLFGSGSGNGTVALWRCDVSQEEESSEPPVVKNVAIMDNGKRERVTAVRWNACVSGLVACLGGSEANLWDSSRPDGPIVTCPLAQGAMDACWDHQSKLLCCINQNKSITVFDPRQPGQAIAAEEAHAGKNTYGRIVSGGHSVHGELNHLLFTTGASVSRDRELAVWDVRQLDKGCVARTKVGAGASSSPLIPMVVPDTKILLLLAKGESVIRAFEASSGSPFVFGLNQNATGSLSALGAALLPVAGCDIMGCEVSRIFKLTRESIETVRVEIPRKSKATFHEDIFPDTADVLSPPLSVQAWEDNGEGELPMTPVMALAKRYRTQRGDSVAEGHKAFGGASDDEESESNQEATSGEPEEFVPSKMDNLMSKKLGYIPKFKYARSAPVKKDLTVFNMNISNAPSLAVNGSRFAVTWQGGGGPVYVGNLAEVGKIDHPESVPVLNGHSRPVLAVDFAPYDERVLATAADDCVVRVWRLGQGDSPQDFTPSATSEAFSGHQSSVRLVKFHPSCEGLVASGSPDGTVKVWDVNSASCALSLPVEGEYVVDMCWNYNGSLLATMNRSNAFRVHDPRGGVVQSGVEKAHVGAKQCFATWIGDTPYVLTSGCARMGSREFAIWDTRRMSDPLSRTSLGNGATSFEPMVVEDNGLVFLAARGENTFHIYELEGLSRCSNVPEGGSELAKPHSCQPYSAPGDPTCAVALLPRRVLKPELTQFASIMRLTASALEPVTFDIPRSQELREYYADDVYCDTRSLGAAMSGQAWLDGEDANPVLESMEDLLPSGGKRLSQRDPAIAHAALKRAQENTARFRKLREEEDAKKRDQDQAFARMQHLAIQHEKYNPNLSMGGHHAADRQFVDNAGDEVADDEWE